MIRYCLIAALLASLAACGDDKALIELSRCKIKWSEASERTQASWSIEGNYLAICMAAAGYTMEKAPQQCQDSKDTAPYFDECYERRASYWHRLRMLGVLD